MMHADRQDRKIIASLIKGLSLRHSDPEKRMAAIVTAGEKGDAAMLSAMKQQLKEGPNRQVSPRPFRSPSHASKLLKGTKNKKSVLQGRLPRVAPPEPLRL